MMQSFIVDLENLDLQGGCARSRDCEVGGKIGGGVWSKSAHYLAVSHECGGWQILGEDVGKHVFCGAVNQAYNAFFDPFPECVHSIVNVL